jgi:copper(I)-binding protein
MKIQIALIVSLAILTFSPYFAADHEEAHPIIVSDAWIRLSPPMLKINAGYFTITNRSRHNRTLTGAHSQAFSSITLHTTELSGSMARMRPMDKLIIPAHETMTFAPGAMHLMLVGRKEKLAAGDQVKIIFSFDNGHKTTSLFSSKR